MIDLDFETPLPPSIASRQPRHRLVRAHSTQWYCRTEVPCPASQPPGPPRPPTRNPLTPRGSNLAAKVLPVKVRGGLTVAHVPFSFQTPLGYNRTVLLETSLCTEKLIIILLLEEYLIVGKRNTIQFFYRQCLRVSR